MNYSLWPEIPADVRKQLIEYSDLSARLLHGRGIETAEEARAFLKPDFSSSTIRFS